MKMNANTKFIPVACIVRADLHGNFLGWISWQSNFIMYDFFVEGHISRRKLIFIISMTALGIVLTTLSVIIYTSKMRMIRRKKATKKSHRQEASQLPMWETPMNSNRYLLDKFDDAPTSPGKGPDLPIFALAVVRAATNDFSLANKLGEGGFGAVYKVKISWFG